MKILFINPTVRYYDEPRHVPLGILQLMAILERDHPQIKFQFYDANAFRIDGPKKLDSAVPSDASGSDHPIVRARWVILSYSSGGRATADELNDVFAANGKVIDVIEIDYKRNVMAGMKWTNDWIRDAESPNREFLFLIDKA